MPPPIIIFRLGSLGDTVVALPCFHAIARRFPERRRLVLTNVPVAAHAPPLEQILGPAGLIDGVIEYPVGVRGGRALLKLAGDIRATGADTLVYLTRRLAWSAVARDVLFFHACGLRTIIGAPLSQDLLRNQPEAAYTTLERESERLARTMRALEPLDLADRGNWDLRLTLAEQATAARALAPIGDHPFVAINMGGKVARNDWGEPNWRRLIGEIEPLLPGCALVAVGAGADSPRARAVLEQWKRPTADLCGRLAPRESAAALQAASLFIGHDSGPMHLAAAMGAPTVGVFGDNTIPRIWHPYGPITRAIHDQRGIHMVVVEQVVEAVRSLAPELRLGAAAARGAAV